MDMDDRLRQTLKQNLADGALSDDETAELLTLLHLGDARTPDDRIRYIQLIEQAMTFNAEPPADPLTVGWSRLPKELSPELGCLSYVTELLMKLGREVDVYRVGKVLFRPFLGLRVGAVGADDGIGWLGWVSDGKQHNRSDDLFETMEKAERWCHSVIFRKCKLQ